MKNNDDSPKNDMLEIETLQKEYDIVLNQYQEAMKTYIDELKENETKNACFKFKKSDKNISQLCYDKIWHEQGCLTDTPQVDTDKTLDELVQNSYNISVSKNDSDIKQCYGDNSNVVTNNLIQNGTFSNPTLSDNSFKYISGDSEVTNWNFNGGALMNNSEAWLYEIPYPDGNQAVSLEVTSSISQKIKLTKNAKYYLELYCSGRNCCDGVNPIKIELYDSDNKLILNILEITPTIVWSKYNASFTSPDTKEYKLTFSGTSETGNKSSAIQNIKLTEEKSLIYPNILNYISLKGKAWWGINELKTENVETENECIALCDSDANCSGATFNPTKKMCWTRSGDSEITSGIIDDSEYGSDYALVTKLKYHMIQLKSLNEKLLTLNEKIIDKIKNRDKIKNNKTDKKYENYENEKNENSDTTFKDYYKVLMNHRHKIEEELNDYKDVESQYENSALYVKQQHWMYNIYVLVSLILVFITIKKISEGDSMIFVFLMVGFIWAFYIFIMTFYKIKK